jgi:hypothetical protein
MLLSINGRSASRRYTLAACTYCACVCMHVIMCVRVCLYRLAQVVTHAFVDEGQISMETINARCMHLKKMSVCVCACVRG